MTKMGRFDEIKIVPPPKYKSVELCMEELVLKIRHGESAFKTTRYSDVKIFYKVARKHKLEAHSRKEWDNSGWVCWIGDLGKEVKDEK